MAKTRQPLPTTIALPDGRSVAVLMKPRKFKNGNRGFSATIPRFALDDNIFGGMMIVYKMVRDK